MTSVQQDGYPLASDLQDLVLATDDIENFLQQLVEVAVGVIDGNIVAGLTLVRDGHPATVASSHKDAARYDEAQYGHDQGPCLTAMRTGQVILITDLAHEQRFGDYRAETLDLGVRSSLSLPLDGGDHAMGALNLYSQRPNSFGETEQIEGRRFAEEASRALHLAVRLTRQVEFTEQLQAALASRTVIDQAIGMLMARNQCGPEKAFTTLRAVSQLHDLTVHELAVQMIAEKA